MIRQDGGSEAPSNGAAINEIRPLSVVIKAAEHALMNADRVIRKCSKTNGKKQHRKSSTTPSFSPKATQPSAVLNNSPSPAPAALTAKPGNPDKTETIPTTANKLPSKEEQTMEIDDDIPLSKRRKSLLQDQSKDTDIDIQHKNTPVDVEEEEREEDDHPPPQQNGETETVAEEKEDDDTNNKDLPVVNNNQPEVVELLEDSETEIEEEQQQNPSIAPAAAAVEEIVKPQQEEQQQKEQEELIIEEEEEEEEDMIELVSTSDEEDEGLNNAIPKTNNNLQPSLKSSMATTNNTAANIATNTNANKRDISGLRKPSDPPRTYSHLPKNNNINNNIKNRQSQGARAAAALDLPYEFVNKEASKEFNRAFKKPRAPPGMGASAIQKRAKELLNEMTAQTAATVKEAQNAWHGAAMAWRQKNKPSQEEVKRRQKEDSARMTETVRLKTLRTPAERAHASGEPRNRASIPGAAAAAAAGGRGATGAGSRGAGTRSMPLASGHRNSTQVPPKPNENAAESEWRTYYRLSNQAKVDNAGSFVQVLCTFKVPLTDPSRVKDAYRLAVRMYHPDSNSKDRAWSTSKEKMEAEEVMKIINERKPDDL